MVPCVASVRINPSDLAGLGSPSAKSLPRSDTQHRPRLVRVEHHDRVAVTATPMADWSTAGGPVGSN